MSAAEEYVSSTIMVEIPEFTEKYIDSKTVTFFVVNVYDNYSKQKWKIEKRYSDFETLHKNLEKLLPNVPGMPGKSLFKITSYDALTKRRWDLEQFLKQASTRKDILATDYFNAFWELEKHSPQIVYNEPLKLSEFKELPWGIRDFYYYREESMIFIVCCDMNIASRVDAYITNVNLPWEKKTDAHISVGAAFAFQVLQGKNNEFFFEKKWAKSFPEQTGVVNFDESNCIWQIGWDSGRIDLFKTSVDSKYIQYDELMTVKPHKNRVMGLALDQTKGWVYSCSSDKKFMIVDMNAGNSIIEVAESVAGYTSLYFDKKNERVFLTNEVGLISVFLTNSPIPTLVTLVQTHTNNSIRGVHIDLIKNYLFTATNKGNISVVDLGLAGKEKFIKELSYFGGNVEIRIVRYNSENNEWITGDQSGKITIWSLKKGESIYAWQAHDSAITQIYYEERSRIIMSGSKDKRIICWKWPDKWINDDLRRFEENEIKNINDTMAMLKIQKTLTGNESDSSDDSCNGWDIRA